MSETNVKQKWAIPLKGCIQLLCLLLIIYASITTTRASTTKMEFDDEDVHHSILTEKEIDEQILNDLNNLNIEYEPFESKELSIEEVMSPEDQLIYMQEINNIVKKYKSPQAEIEMEIEAESDYDKITTTTVYNVDKKIKQGGLDNNVIFDFVSSIPDEDISSILTELMPSEQWQEVKRRIIEVFPEAKSKGFELDKIEEFLSNDDIFLDMVKNEPDRKGAPILAKHVDRHLSAEHLKVTTNDFEHEIKHYINNKKVDKNKKNQIKRPTSANGVLTIIKPPCIDLYPNRCLNMKNDGYCFRPDKMTYMHQNCPLSCDICNPQIQKELTGVPQKFDFMPITKKNEVTNSMIEKRARNVIAQTTKYYKEVIENNQDEHMRSKFLLCKNRHHACAIWAVIGFCETKPESMTITCGPVCRLCHFEVEHERRISNFHFDQQYYDKLHFDDALKIDKTESNTGLSFGTSPFLRGDLIGIFESIEADRIIRGWRTATTTNYSNKQRKSWHKFAQLDKFLPIIHKYDNFTNRYKAHPMERKRRDTHRRYPIHNSGPVIIQFDNFLSEKECHSLLNLARLLHINAKTNIDGFGAHTTDAHIRDDGKLHMVRTNSRKYILPFMNDNDVTSKKDPIIQQIFDRIELITGVPQFHIEIPLQFDKFVFDQFQDAQLHGVQQSMAEEAMKNFFHENNVKIDKNPGMNPRILGLSIFLNDDFLGGDIAFPNLQKVQIKPKLGRGVLYPCLLSLDEWEKSVEDLSSASSTSDLDKSKKKRKVIIKNEDVDGKSWNHLALNEDELLKATKSDKDNNVVPHVDLPVDKQHLRRLDTTIMSHMKVKGGVKYTLNIFLRLDPYLSQNQ